MAEVLARSRESARAVERDRFNVTEQAVADDYTSYSIEELQSMLNGTNDFVKRVEIRKVLKNKKNSSETESSSKINKTTGNSLPGNGSTSPLIRRFEVTSQSPVNNNNNNNKESLKPWLSEHKKPAYRSVSSLSFKAPNSKAPEGSPVSRFQRGEYSASLRVRPTYKAPENANNLNRGDSVKLYRPKDFLTATPKKRTVLHSKTVPTEPIVLEKVVTKTFPISRTRDFEPEPRENSSIALEKSPCPAEKSPSPQQKSPISEEKSPLPPDTPSSDTSPTAVSVPLKRSESSKENRTSESEPALPFIPIVRGNKRRSRGILGRVLTFKIGSEKLAAPSVTQHPPVIQTAPVLTTEATVPIVEEVDAPEQDSISHVEKSETLKSSKTFQIEAPATQPVVASQTVEVTCAFSSPIEEKDSEFTNQTEESTKEIRSLIQELIDIVVNSFTDDVSKSDTLQDDTELECENTDELLLPESPVFELKRKESNLSQENIYSSCESCATGITVIEVKPAEQNRLIVKETTEVKVSVQHIETPQFTEDIKEVIFEESITVEQEPQNSPVFVEDKDEKFENVEETEEVRAKEDSLTLFDSSAEIHTEKFNEVEERKRFDSLSSESSEEQILSSDSDSLSSEDSLEGEYELEMDSGGRYAIRTRLGANTGSVKSRIQARESPDFAKSAESTKKVRTTVESRVFRNAPDLKSRMNKFASNGASNEKSPQKEVKRNRSPRIRNTSNGEQKENRKIKEETPKVAEPEKTPKPAERKLRKTEDKIILNGSSKSKTPVESTVFRVKDAKSDKNDEKSLTTFSVEFTAEKSSGSASPAESLDRIETASNVAIDEMKSLSKSQNVEETDDSKPDSTIQKDNAHESDITKHSVANNGACEVTDTDKTIEKSESSTTEKDGHLAAEEKLISDQKDVALDAEKITDDILSIASTTSNKTNESEDSPTIRDEDSPTIRDEDSPTIRDKETEATVTSQTQETALAKDEEKVESESSDDKEAIDVDDVTVNDVTTPESHDVTATDSADVKTSETNSVSTKTDDVMENGTDDVIAQAKVNDVHEQTSEDLSTPIETKVVSKALELSDESNHDSKDKECTKEKGAELRSRIRRYRRTEGDKKPDCDVTEVSTGPPEIESDRKSEPRRRRRIRSQKTPPSSAASSPEAEEAPGPKIESEVPQEKEKTAEVEAVAPVKEKRDELATSDAVTGDERPNKSDIKVKRVRSMPGHSVQEITVTEVDLNEHPQASLQETKTATADKIPTPEDKPSEKSNETQEENKSDAPEATMRYTLDNLSSVTEEAILEKLLYEAEEFDDRRKIRRAIRDLRKKKAETGGVTKENTTKSWSATKTTSTTTTRALPNGSLKTESKETTSISGYQRKTASPLGSKKDVSSKSLADKYSLGSSYSSTRKDMSSTSTKKVGSIFDREDAAASKRPQTDKRREVMRNRSMPAPSAKDARKMFTAMDNSSNKSTGGKKVGRSPTFVVPNANNVKQMLLKWCQAKTRGYDHVDINNFSGSWASGMAFCALVHNFFPEAYDYSTLDPKARAKNFTLAFDAAERLGEIPPLLDPEDMIRMAEPDWKCVYTYIMEFYKKIRELQLT